MNYGKIWENDFKKALGQTCIRLYDTTNGYAGVKNPCDFVYYLYPYYFLFELKSTQGDSLPFSNIKLCFGYDETIKLITDDSTMLLATADEE